MSQIPGASLRPLLHWTDFLHKYSFCSPYKLIFLHQGTFSHREKPVRIIFTGVFAAASSDGKIFPIKFLQNKKKRR
jgi:hypothetical protein